MRIWKHVLPRTNTADGAKKTPVWRRHSPRRRATETTSRSASLGHEARLADARRIERTGFVVDEVPLVAELQVPITFGTHILHPHGILLEAVTACDRPRPRQRGVDRRDAVFERALVDAPNLLVHDGLVVLVQHDGGRVERARS